MGDQAFNYILSNASCKIKFKPDGSNTEYTVSIKDFFDPNCNAYVTTIFSLGNGDTGSTPVPTKTAISYTDWNKE